MKEITPVDLLRYVHPWPESLICIGMIPRKGFGNGKTSWLWLKRKDIAKHLRQLKIANTRAQRNIYYSVASYTTRKRIKENVKAIQVLWLDFDAETEASRAFAQGEGWQDIPVPNIVVETSPGHAQVLWLLEDSMPSADIEGTLRGLSRTTGADIMAVDSTRILRLPGFENVNRGRCPVKAYMIHERRLTLQEFQELKKRYFDPLPKAKSAIKRCSVVPNVVPDEISPYKFRFIGPRAQNNARRRWENTIKGGKSPSEADWAVTGYFCSLGIPKEEIVQFLKELRPEKHEKYHEYTVEKFLQQKNNPRATNTEVQKFDERM